jgi:hypothetical protein
MESALSQSDILYCIIQHSRDTHGHGTLATLARTSRLISISALDTLWRTVNIIVLARCMPPRYWNEIEIYTPFEDRDCGNGPEGRYDSRLVSISLARKAIGVWCATSD